jgi:HK97 family phage prohead protease
LPILDFVASDETLDRYSEIIRASGWRLDHYLRNPVFQNSHQYGDVMFTLGKALETRVVDGRLRQRSQFATDANPMARIAYGLYKGSFLNAVSVGFIPIRWEDGTDGMNGPRRIYLEQELLEVSAVSIPANPNALVMGLRSEAVDESDVRELLEIFRAALSNDECRRPNDERSTNDKCQIQEFCSNEKAIRNADTRALGVPGDEAWLLRTVKGLAEVMRKANNKSASQRISECHE